MESIIGLIGEEQVSSSYEYAIQSHEDGTFSLVTPTEVLHKNQRYTSDDVFSIINKGTEMNFYMNEEILYNVSAREIPLLKAVASLYTQGGAIKNAQYK